MFPQNICWMFSQTCISHHDIEITGKYITSAIRQEKRISKRAFQENLARQIFWKTNIWAKKRTKRTCAYLGVRNVRFSGNLTCFVFLKHPFWDSPFLSYYRQLLSEKKWNWVFLLMPPEDFPQVLIIIPQGEGNQSSPQGSVFLKIYPHCR